MKAGVDCATLGAVAIACAVAPWAGADVVTDWDTVLLNAIRTAGGGPGPLARDGAMLHVAMYDAINSVDHTYQPMHTNMIAPPDTSKVAAAAQAAHDVMSQLFPATSYPLLAPIIDNALNNSLLNIPPGDPMGTSNGIALGHTVANSTMAWRAAVGSTNSVLYTKSPGPGVWQPTYPDFSNAWGPGWGSVTPMVMNSGSQFRPVPPPALNSTAYVNAVNEVKALGALTGSTRTAQQTNIAYFWANDRNGSEKPPGQLNAITQIIAANKGNTLEQNARLFALVNIAMLDASVAAWDEKFQSNLWRPIDAIRQANTVAGSPIVADPNWEPLSDLLNGATPAFPAYISGHATFAGAWASILKDFYGTDAISFDATSDDLAGTRHFDSLSAAAAEDARSRIYLGVHYQFDADFGVATGNSVGDYVFANALQAVPEPTSLGLMVLGGLTLLGRRRRRDVNQSSVLEQ